MPIPVVPKIPYHETTPEQTTTQPTPTTTPITELNLNDSLATAETLKVVPRQVQSATKDTESKQPPAGETVENPGIQQLRDEQPLQQQADNARIPRREGLRDRSKIRPGKRYCFPKGL